MPAFDPSILLPYLPEFVRGVKATLLYSVMSLGLAIAIGLAVALARLSDIGPLRWVARLYVDVVRGTPALVQIFFIYFGAPALGIRLGAPTSAVIALGLNSGGYLAEIFRSGILGVDAGQVEAGRSLGMSRARTFLRVVLPQAARLAIPSSAGEFTNLIKGTSLLSTISITELTRVAQQVVSVTFRPIEAYLAIALVYFVINSIVGQGSIWLEQALRRAEGLRP
jgi:His/Glu/Gln/Arg/opine family amino acid ABC transporter permease subunit